jgi:hypothetical protein
MIALQIRFPDNLIVCELLKQNHIPCFCEVKGDNFDLSFSEPLPPARGSVQGLSAKDIDARVPALGGSQYSHYCNGMVTLRKLETNEFEITDLLFFSTCLGWCTVAENSTLGPLRQEFLDGEADATEALSHVRDKKKKDKYLRLSKLSELAQKDDR